MTRGHCGRHEPPATIHLPPRFDPHACCNSRRCRSDVPHRDRRRTRRGFVRLRPEAPGAGGHRHVDPARQAGRDHGRIGLRQDHDPAPDRRAAPPAAGADHRRRAGRRHARSRRIVRDAPQDRHAVPVRRAVHRYVGVRERRVPDARAHRAAGRIDPRPGADEAERRRLARGGPTSSLPSCRAEWRAASRWRARSRSTRC